MREATLNEMDSLLDGGVSCRREVGIAQSPQKSCFRVAKTNPLPSLCRRISQFCDPLGTQHCWSKHEEHLFELTLDVFPGPLQLGSFNSRILEVTASNVGETVHDVLP